MILLLLAVTVISLCNGYSFQGTTEYVCKEDNSLLENAAQTTQAPYSLSVTYINTKNVLITISSEHRTPFTEFTIQSLYETTSLNQQSQFILLDESGAPLQKCSSGQLQYTRDLSWTTEDEVVGKVQFVVNVWYNSSTYWELKTSVDFPQVSEGRIPPVPWCGHLKGCLSNCTDVDCEYLVTWFQRDNYTVTFEIYSKLNPFTGGNTWAAVGFSTNQSMPGSSIMMCLNSNNQMSAQSGYTTGHTYAKVDDPNELTKFVRGDTNGNVFHCVMNRTITSMDEKIFDLKQEWFLLFAYGNVVNGVPAHHDFRIASSKPQDFLAPLKVRDIIVPDPWCGKIKGCFSNCTKTECEYIVSWMHDFTTVTFDIQTKVPPGTVYNSWAAVGLSFDQQMSGSSIMMCMSDFGLVRAELGFTTGHTYSRIDDIKSSLKLVNSSLEGNIFRCTMKRDIVSSGDMIFDLRDNWYLLFAHGPLSKGVPMHHDYRIPSDRPFAFLAPLAKPLVHPSVQDSNIPPDPACGKTKACFSNCTANDCQYLISWYHSQSTITFNIQTKITTDIMDSWAAIGLSSNQSMAGSSIMMCLNKDGTMSAEFGYTTGHTYAKLNDTKHTLTFVNGSTVGNIFQCIVQRDINLSTDKIFGLRNEWFLLFAYGPVTNGVPMHHYNKTFSIKAIDFLAVSEKSEPLSHIQPDPSCGKTKGCFTNCTDTDCEYLISWTHDDKTITFDIQTKVVIGDSMNAWAAIGLTAYPSMPGTSVMMCRTKDGTMSAEFGYNPGYIYNKLNDTDHTLKFVGGGTNGNVFHCTVQRDIDISTDKIFSMKTKWYMLFAHGITKEGNPQEHDNKTMSKSSIDFLAKFESNIGLMRSTKSLIIMKDEPTDNSMSGSVVNFQANPGYSVDYLKTFDDQNPHVAVYTVDDVPLDVSLDQNIITLDKDCNVTKGCVHSCSHDNCHYVISWIKDETDVIFNITARVNPGTISHAWMAVGLSQKGQMDGSSTMMCLNVNGTVYGRYGYTGLYWAYHEIKDVALPVLESYTTGDIFHCSMKRPILSTTVHIFNLTEKWHIIFAHGQWGITRGRVTPEQHDFKFADRTKTDFLAFPVSPTPGNAQNIITLDKDCNVTKGCVHSCSHDNCHYVISWIKDETDVIFNITARVNPGTISHAWMAVGLSQKGQMDGSSTMMCLHVNGTVYGRYGYTGLYWAYHEIKDVALPLLESHTTGDIFHCSMKRRILSTTDHIFNLTEKWHIIFAHGQVGTRRGRVTLEQHDFKFAASTKTDFLAFPVSPTSGKAQETQITPDNGCGVTKSCFDDCNNSHCSYLITWTNDTSDFTFKISAQIKTGSPNTAWVAVGFSPDGNMPRSSMIMCLNVNGTFTGEYGYSTNYTEYKPLINGTLPIKESSTNGDIVRCTIERPITASSDRIFNLTKEWHILFAYGQVSQGIPQYHDFRIGGSNIINFLELSNGPTTVKPETTSEMPQSTSSGSAITPDNGCGVTKSCFDDCNNSHCSYLITWTNDTSDVTFKISAQIKIGSPNTAWVAVGFSPDGQMPRSTMIMCLNVNGTFTGEYGYSTNYTVYKPLANGTIPVLESSTNGNIVRCTIKRPITASSDRIFNLTKEWHILFAFGQVTVNKGIPSANYHDFRVGGSYTINFLKTSNVPTTVNPETTSPNTPQHMTTSDAPNKITLDPGCGVTKGCFPQCTGTICTSLVTWQKDKDDVIFEIEEDVSRNPVDRWIAIGFSADQKMGETSVVICQNKGSGDVSVSLGYNDGYSFSVLPAKESVNVLKDTSMSITGQIMRCHFRRAVNSSDPKVYDLKSQWYLLMGNGPITAGTPTRHETTPIATSSKTDFLKFQKVDGGVQASAVIKIHGCLMVSAWILFSSVGVMLARHFKKQWAKTIWNDHKVWFQIHRGCMVLAALLTAGGFVLILVENKGFRELAETGEKKFLNYHPIMGIVVFSLTILNPIIAFLRCGPNHEKRPIFNWVHSFIGTSAHILGAVTVGFGVNIPKAGLDSSVNYIIIAYAIAFVVIEFLLHRLTQHNNTSHDKNLYDVGGSSDSFPEQPSEESTGMKMSLFLHVVAMVTCTTILLYKIINS